MIEKNEILQLAKNLDLSADTVEKDYVLGWMLHGISEHIELKKWLFKGGTSLKKCFFETFRFSEDLDFTIKESEHLDVDFLLRSMREVADSLYEETGIEFFQDQFRFKIRPNGSSKLSAEGTIHYNGPLKRRQGSVATIKIDLTNDEIIVLDSERKKVDHPYTDEPASGIWTNCYAFEEVIAEKIRALGQRARPRDVYDVVHFFRNRGLIKNPQLVYNTLVKKCAYKSIQVPTFASIEAHEKIDELVSQWEHMLAHQLPSLPPLESFWKDINPFFEWLNNALKEDKTMPTGKPDEVVFQYGRVTGSKSFDHVLQKIQFAAANRVCVMLGYADKQRTIEPLSFRRSRDGNRLFYGFERESNQVKAFSISKIDDVSVTNLPYTEKYPVEISASGAISMPPVRRTR